MADQPSKPESLHVAIVPSPGIGHLIPLAELAKRLLRNHNVTSTFIVPSDGPPSKSQLSVLSALPSGIDHLFLPPVSFDDLPAGDDRPKIETLITLTVARSLPQLRDALASLRARGLRLAAVVVDLFATDAFDVARELGLASFVFYPSTATVLALFLHLPELDAAVSGEFRDQPEPIRIPGCIPIPGSELLDPLQDRKNDAYRSVLHNAIRYRSADGVMVNSFAELEPGAVTWLLKQDRPRVFPVGPLVNVEPTAKADELAALTWLDNQPRGSVLYVSFGSGGTLGSRQIAELALGLERSEQRFLWVVRRPNDAVANATYFNAHGQNDTSLDFLPEGFLNRTKDRGLVVHSWAPQAQILRHVSTGGFLTHCGWNSTLESVANGVPLIAWPLYAEQRTNAFMLENDNKVALRPRRSNDTGLVTNDEISRVVKGLIEGEEGKRLRNRMKDLKEAASRALTQDGASTKALSQVVDQWKNHIRKVEQK